MTRTTLSLLIAAAMLTGCGRLGDSAWNPFSGGGARSAPETLEPEGGYGTVLDARPSVPQLLGAEWQSLPEGRLLVVRGFAPVKGYHSAMLVRAGGRTGPDRLAPDPDGVLRLRFVAVPPPADSPAARMPASPATDTITVALPLPTARLARLTGIEIQGGDRVIQLRR